MLSCLATEQGRQQGSRKSPSRSAECSSTEWPGIDREGRLLQDCKAVPFPRSALGHLSCPQKSDFQLPGVRRSPCEAGQTRTGENISPRPSLSTRSRTIRQWEIIGKKKLPSRAQRQQSRKEMAPEERGFVSLKEEGKGMFVIGESFFLLSVIISMSSKMKCLQTTTQTHKDIPFFIWNNTEGHTVPCTAPLGLIFNIRTRWAPCFPDAWLELGRGPQW